MTRGLRRTLFSMFFLSGFCGLLYQVIWVRLGFAAFGVLTPILSITLSVFMAGLFAGSWAAGRWVDPLCRRLGLNGAHFYAAAEATLAIGAFCVPWLFGLTEEKLLPVGASASGRYLLWSSLGIALTLFPWCFAMGATFPSLLAYLRRRCPGETASFSFLYLANVLGAMAGTFFTAVVLVELLGFRGTLTVAATLNALVAVMGVSLAGHPLAEIGPETEPKFSAAKNRKCLATLFLTGFTSMAMEVVWTRAFAPILRTEVYSFAGLLLMYLIGTWLGSWSYRRHLASGAARSAESILYFLCFAAILPLVPTDPRLHLGVFGVLLGILPFCYALGYLTPQLIDRLSGGRPHAAGFAYGMNVLGCILGPLAASYLFLPEIGARASLIWLAVPYLFLWMAWERPARRLAPVLAVILSVAVTTRTYEDLWQRPERGARVLRDHTASVVAHGQGMNKMLLVNGMGITSFTSSTKLMAHLPLAHLDEPRSALVICFGMGTTFRSLLTWDIDVTAVELVPSVAEVFPYFFAEAKELVAHPNAHIVIDDGRRFLRRTAQVFDLITIDPPPPVAAAGSSLLYSREFYELAKARLARNGILQQWLPAAERKTLEAVAKSLFESFPYVRVFSLPIGGGGHHFLASMRPIPYRSAHQLMERLNLPARMDLVEWPDTGFTDPKTFLDDVLSHEVDRETLETGRRVRVSDDRPYNEYYLLRRTFGRG